MTNGGLCGSKPLPVAPSVLRGAGQRAGDLTPSLSDERFSANFAVLTTSFGIAPFVKCLIVAIAQPLHFGEIRATGCGTSRVTLAHKNNVTEWRFNYLLVGRPRAASVLGSISQDVVRRLYNTRRRDRVLFSP